MNDGTTPLILAARLAVEGMVEELIHCHADINAVDDHGEESVCCYCVYQMSLFCLNNGSLSLTASKGSG